MKIIVLHCAEFQYQCTLIITLLYTCGSEQNVKVQYTASKREYSWRYRSKVLLSTQQATQFPYPSSLSRPDVGSHGAPEAVNNVPCAVWSNTHTSPTAILCQFAASMSQGAAAWKASVCVAIPAHLHAVPSGQRWASASLSACLVGGTGRDDPGRDCIHRDRGFC